MENINFNKEINDNNKLIIKIFNLIKLQDWINLTNIIKNNDFDYNIRDTSGIYLLEYLILFNQIDIIKILFNKNLRIDITDDNNRSIIYNIIKFSYIPILKLFLDKNKTDIGNNILDIYDNDYNIPLFYAIKFYNIEAIKLILNYTTNFYMKNNDGENALHLAIKSQNLEIFKIIFEKNNKLDLKNKNGETSLHLIIKYKCYDIFEYLLDTSIDIIEIINMVEYKYNFTILHYISISIDLNFLVYFNKYNLLEKLDGNIQDNSGNIFYNYFINNLFDIKNIDNEENIKILQFNDLCKKINFNINLYNIDGNTPGHLLVNNINFFINNKLSILINYIINKSDLNIQNNLGESMLFILVKNKYWKNISNILIYKKLDIFILTKSTNIIFDYINSNELDEFISIVTNSYLYQLNNKDTSIKWLDYWDNRCKKNIELEELNETEKDLLKSFNDNNNKSICFNIIYNKINNYIKNFTKNKDRYNVNSYPIEHKLNKLIDNYPNVNISTFTGSTLDIINGLFYLLNKFNNNNILVESSLKLLDISKSIINCNTIDFNDINKICEINGFEILWKNKILFIPSSKKYDLIRLINYINFNKSKGTRFLIIPIGIELIIEENIYSHANYLLFDFEKMEVERFEPHGAEHPVDLDYDSELLDKKLKEKINLIPDLKFKYFSPRQYLPKIGFQKKEIHELKSDYIGDPNGFCALWCIWWIDLRISNPDIPREKLVKLLFKELINENYSFKKLIRDYSFYIINIRDELLTKSNSNINEWINDTMSRKNIDTLNYLLINYITKYY
jgi:ankyrin repeat protein